MSLSDHKFQLTMSLTGRTPAVLVAALKGIADGWRVDALGLDPRRSKLMGPVLGYDDIGAVRDVLRSIRRVGAWVGETDRIELHIDAAGFNERATSVLRRLVEKQGDLLVRALGHSVDELGFELTKTGPFPKRTLTIHVRPSLRAGEIAAQIVLALAIVERALTARAASSRLRPYDATCARYDFRCFLLRLRLIGEEFRDTREQLLKRLPGSAAWKYGRPTTASANRRFSREPQDGRTPCPLGAKVEPNGARACEVSR